MNRLNQTTRTPYPWLFLGFGTAYLFFLSRHYIGDGLRYLPEAMGPDLPRPGGLSHVLYPAWVWLVHRAGLLLGYAPRDRIGVVTLLQATNALLAAAGLATLAWLLRLLGVRALVAGLVAACVGLSHAYLLHATDMTEPMPSVPLMLLGIVAAVRRPSRIHAIVVGGVLVGVAASFYLTALGSLVLAAAVLASRSPGEPERASFIRSALFVFSALASLGVIVMIGAFLARQGVWAETVPVPLGLSTGAGIFGRVHPRHLIGGIFGMANALAPLSGWIGLSRIGELPLRQAAYDVFVTGLAVAWLFMLTRTAKRNYRSPLLPMAKAATVGCLLWFAGVYLFACAWDSTYEKLWIGGVIAAGIVFALISEAHLRVLESRVAPTPSRPSFPGRTSIPLALLLLASVMIGAVPRRFSENEDLVLARQLGARVGPRDLVVAAGWDGPSVYFRLLVAPEVTTFSLVDEAIGEQRDPPRAQAALAAAIAAARERGGNVYFLDLLDMTEGDWHWFLGYELGLPYAILDQYRRRSAPVAALSAADRTLALRRLVF